MGLITKEVEISITSNMIAYYERLGYIIPKRKASDSYFKKTHKEYVYDLNSKITVNVNDLPIGSDAPVRVKCDFCGEERVIGYDMFRKSYDNHGIYACYKCGHKKTEIAMLEKYGKKSPMQIQEFKEKQMRTMMDNWGVTNPQKNEEIKMRTIETNRIKYGFDYGILNPDIRQKAIDTSIKNWGVTNVFSSNIIQERIKKTFIEKYGADNIMRVPEVRKKLCNSLFENGTCAASQQQKYINSLYNGVLNYPVGMFNVDIVLIEDRIAIEYDGGGHFLSVILGDVTQKEFDQKQIIRNSIMKRQGYKLIRIQSIHDKLPSDDILLQMLNLSKQYFADFPNHSWIEWDIDKGIYRNAEHKDGVLFNYGELRGLPRAS